MTMFAGPLRAARAEVVPRIPELAPQLAENRFAVLEALEDAFVARGHDPAEVPARNWNKVERHTIAGFAIREQAAFLVEGEDATARFKQFQTNGRGARDAKAFRGDLIATQVVGARHVEATYRRGDDDHQWWRLAARRYRHLGWAAMRSYFRRDMSTDIGPTVPLEGVYLHTALRTPALHSAVHAYLGLVRELTTGLPKEERLKAAHDMAHLTTSLAGLHFLELTHGKLAAPEMTAALHEPTGRYQAIYKDRAELRRLYPRFTDLPNATLKCPAHVRPQGPEVASTLHTPLQNLFHAAINAAADYDILYA